MNLNDDVDRLMAEKLMGTHGNWEATSGHISHQLLQLHQDTQELWAQLFFCLNESQDRAAKSLQKVTGVGWNRCPLLHYPHGSHLGHAPSWGELTSDFQLTST